MRQFLAIASALVNQKRVRMLAVLQDRELCECQIAKATGLPKAFAHYHLIVLARAGLVLSRRQGRWLFYRPVDDASAVVQNALQWLRDAMANDACVAKDIRQLAIVLKRYPVERCKRNKDKWHYATLVEASKRNTQTKAASCRAKSTSIMTRRAAYDESGTPHGVGRPRKTLVLVPG